MACLSIRSPHGNRLTRRAEGLIRGNIAGQPGQSTSDNTLGLRVGRFAALPRQAVKGIDQDRPWKSLR
jgi:hypothetical protein